MKKRVLAISSLALALVLALSTFILLTVRAQGQTNDKQSDIFSPISGVIEGEGGFVNEFEFDEMFYTSNTYLKEENFIVPRSDNGVAVFAKSSIMEFKYNNALNLNNFSMEDSIVELLPYIGEVDGANRSQYAKINHITITLTDTENPMNTVGIHFEEQGSNNAIYGRVLFNGNDMSCSWDSATGKKIIRNGEYGIYLSNGSSFGHTNITRTPQYNYRTGEMNYFSMHFDYAEKYVYFSHVGHNDSYTQTSIKYAPVLDLDDEGQVGIGKAWGGFEKDTAYLSVKVEFGEAITSTKKGGIIVKSVAGENLDGSLSADGDYPVPEITAMYDEYGVSLPDGAVNVDYPIPSVFASDYFYGITADDDISVQVFNLSDVENPVYEGKNGGVFKPTVAGSYKVVYTAKNVKHQNVLERTFTVLAKQTPIMISLAQAPDDLLLRSYFVVPQVITSGGSGNLKTTESLYYNGLEVDFGEDRRVFIDKAGTVNLKVETVGYIGEPVIKNFSFKVNDNVLLIVENVPMAIIGNNAETIILPSATAYDISNNNAELPVTITADGANVPASREIKTDKTSGEVTVIYSAGGKSLTYEIKVLYSENEFTPVSYATTVGSATLSDGSNGIEIYPSKDGDGLKWLYPIVTGFGSETTVIKLRNIAGKINYKYLDLNFTDFANPQKNVFIRIEKNYSVQNSSLVSINGAGNRVQLSVGLDTDDNILNLYVSNNALFTQAGYMLCDFSDVYDAELSMFSVTFGGVMGESAIALSQLSNQNMVLISNIWKDAIPVVSFEKPFAKTQRASKGDTIVIPSASAYDLTSSMANVTLQVKDSKGNEVLKISDLSNGASFTASELGYYNLSFSVVDGNGSKGKATFIIQVLDGVNPVLTIEERLERVQKLGTTVEIPNATATDDLDGALEVKVFIRDLSSYATQKLIMGEEFTFNKTGKFEIVYNAVDLSGNYTYNSYVVEVE